MFDFSPILEPRPGRRVTPFAGSRNFWCGTSETDPKPILYFSASMGSLAIEASIPHSYGLHTRCLSYGYLKTKAVNFGLNYGNNRHCRLFLDSGAFTLQKQKPTVEQAVIYMRKYSHYLEETYGWWDWYAGVDYKRDSKLIRETQAVMEAFGSRPTPVYHGDASLDYLRRYCEEGYKLIAIGRPPKVAPIDLDHFYGSCHEMAAKYGTSLHGLQETGKRMFKYPWWSVDSSSWLFGSAHTMLYHFNPERREFYHVYMSERKQGMKINWVTCSPELRRSILEFAARFRITEENLKTNYATRNFYNAAVMYEATLLNRKIHMPKTKKLL